MPSSIAPPDIRGVVSPVLAALPGAAVSTEPPTVVLPTLSPILRQRVQLLSSASKEPWIRLLTYEPANVAQLTSVTQSGILDPHPVSGEIELDWDSEVDVRYKRLDQETLQAMVVLKEPKLFFRLVYCVGDPDGGDGWRVGEVGVADSSTSDSFGGSKGISEAEKTFGKTKLTTNLSRPNPSLAPSSTNGGWSAQTTVAEDEDDDDDGYWDRYDATPSRTPAAKHSPAPRAASKPSPLGFQSSQSAEAEDAYFAQYDSVQPAMDPHDPDEDEELPTVEQVEYYDYPMLPKHLQQARDAATSESAPANEGPSGQSGTSRGGPVLAQPIPVKPDSPGSHGSQEESWVMAQPRRGSSTSSRASETVTRLEGMAESRQQAEFGVKQHISRSIKSLFLLSRASGIDREEFERMVRTELDVLSMVEGDI